jgi:lipoprotein-releasing system ATP-binding protein
MLRAIDLHRSYKSPQGDLRILRGINFEIAKGDMSFILGRSGAGKSTLLHLLGGLDKPTSGAVEFEGRDVAKMNEKTLANYRNKKVGFIFQFYHLLPELTVMENVELPSIIAGKRASKRVKQLLENVGLYERRKHLPRQLSGGEQQRAAIARALVNEPEIVLCDEPTGNLDEETAESIQELILSLNQRGHAFCIVTHEESFAKKGNRIFKLHEGIIEPILAGPKGRK